MSGPMNDNAAVQVRCPKCQRLLARRLPDGSLEVAQGGKHLVFVRVGRVVCCRCSVAVAVSGSDPGSLVVTLAS